MTVEVIATPASSDPPRVILTVTGIPAGTARLQVSRRVGGRLLRAVRSDRVVTGTTETTVDWEAPLGVPVYYDVIPVDAGGTALAPTAVSSPVTLPDPPESHAWISDPLDQTTPMLVRCLVGTDEARVYPASGSVVTTMDAGRYASMGSRPGLEVWPVTLWAEGDAEVAQLRRLLVGDYATPGGPAGILVRVAGWHQLPPMLYGISMSPSEQVSPKRDDMWSRWSMDLSVTDGPRLATVIARWAWADLTAFCVAEGLTWGTVKGRFATWTEMSMGPEGY